MKQLRLSEDLAKEVRRVFAKHGWTNKGAEVRVDINRTTLGDMRNGYVPSRDTIVKWAVAINESPRQWLEWAGYSDFAAAMSGAQYSAPNTPEHESGPTPDAPELTREPYFDDLAQAGYSDLPPDEREDIIALVKAKIERIRRTRSSG